MNTLGDSSKIRGTLTLTDSDIKEAIQMWLLATTWGHKLEVYSYSQDVNHNKCKVYYRIRES
jgi:hypothetical protein